MRDRFGPARPAQEGGNLELIVVIDRPNRRIDSPIRVERGAFGREWIVVHAAAMTSRRR